MFLVALQQLNDEQTPPSMLSFIELFEGDCACSCPILTYIGHITDAIHTTTKGAADGVLFFSVSQYSGVATTCSMGLERSLEACRAG